MSPVALLLLSSIALMFMTGHGNCLIECEDPPSSTAVFLDLPKLQLMSILHREVFQTPLRCIQDNSTSTCAKQVCCEEEVGCCFRDQDTNRLACGCKLPADIECTFPAPLAVLQTSVCEPTQHGQISLCIRKDREDDPDAPSITITSGERRYRFDKDTFSQKTQMYDSLNNYLTTGISQLESMINAGARRMVSLEKFTVTELEDGLALDVLDELVDQVLAKRAKGTPYGRKFTGKD